jgi:CRISPR/Cas system-associated exonuclease Cas4 (RecB family)
VEYKTTRSALKEEVNPSYTEQLKTYCLALGKTSGKLFIFYLIPAEWRIYNVTFTDEELNNKKEELLANRDLLLKALTEKNPQLFPGPRYVWECRFCEFKKICPLKQGA